jgi:hypothetical protein
MEFDRLTQWIANTLSTEADDDTPDTEPADPADHDKLNGSAETKPPDPGVDEFALFAAAT